MNATDTAVYYTFSTISQTLGGAIALLAAFVLYRFQLSNTEMEASASHIRTFASGNTRHWMEVAYLEGRPDKVLTSRHLRSPGLLRALAMSRSRRAKRGWRRCRR